MTLGHCLALQLLWDHLEGGLLVRVGLLLWVWRVFVQLFDQERLVLRVALGLPQEALHVLHLVSQVVVGLLQDLDLLRERLDPLLLLEEGLLDRGAEELYGDQRSGRVE